MIFSLPISFLKAPLPPGGVQKCQVHLGSQASPLQQQSARSMQKTKPFPLLNALGSEVELRESPDVPPSFSFSLSLSFSRKALKQTYFSCNELETDLTD